MKSYNQEEYLEAYHEGHQRFEKIDVKMIPGGHVFMPEHRPPICTCTRFDDQRAFENCTNCLGYGVEPIPWSDV